MSNNALVMILDSVTDSDLYVALRVYNSVVTDTTHINTIIAEEFERLNKVRPIPENDSRYLISRQKSDFNSEVSVADDKVYLESDLDVSKLFRVVGVGDTLDTRPLNMFVDTEKEFVSDVEFRETEDETVFNVDETDNGVVETELEVNPDFNEGDTEEEYAFETESLVDETDTEFVDDVSYVVETEEIESSSIVDLSKNVKEPLNAKKEPFTESLEEQRTEYTFEPKESTERVLEAQNKVQNETQSDTQNETQTETRNEVYEPLNTYEVSNLKELHAKLVSNVKSVQRDTQLTARTKKELYKKEIESHMILMLRMNLSMTQADLFKVYEELGILRQAREIFIELNKRNRILVHNGKLRLFG